MKVLTGKKPASQDTKNSTPIVYAMDEEHACAIRARYGRKKLTIIIDASKFN